MRRMESANLHTVLKESLWLYKEPQWGEEEAIPWTFHFKNSKTKDPVAAAFLDLGGKMSNDNMMVWTRLIVANIRKNVTAASHC